MHVRVTRVTNEGTFPIEAKHPAKTPARTARNSGREEEGGGVRSGPGVARTILLFHIISARPSKQPLMVRAFLKVYMELVSYFLFLQEQIKDIIIITTCHWDY